MNNLTVYEKESLKNKKGGNIIKKDSKKQTFVGKKIIKFILIIICLILIYMISIEFLKKFIYPDTYIDIVKEESVKNDIDPYLVLAIIKTESGFDSMAVSKKQAKGLMQIMDSTANDINSEVEETNIYNVNTNIKLGCEYLNYLIETYDGNYYLAVCAYNAGLGNVNEWVKEGIVSENLADSNDTNIPFKETNIYLKKVIGSYNMYKFLYK